MYQQLTCNQVSALLTYYIDNKLSETMRTYMEEHLKMCPKCKEKYLKMIKLAQNFNDISKKISTNENEETTLYQTKQYEEFKSNLSAYIDNELTDDESIRIKKIAISNPVARRDLEDIYNFKRLLHSSFDKTRNDSKDDFTRGIISEITSMHSNSKLDPFYIIMTVFTVMISLIILGVVNIMIG